MPPDEFFPLVQQRSGRNRKLTISGTRNKSIYIKINKYKIIKKKKKNTINDLPSHLEVKHLCDAFMIPLPS
jgi:hypothetical protein